MIGFHLVLPHMKELSESFPNHAKFKLPSLSGFHGNQLLTRFCDFFQIVHL